MNQFIDDIDDEIDIQQTVLKKRSTKKEQELFVEYDRLTFTVCTVSPVKIEPSKNRNLVTAVPESNITARLFQNKMSLANLVVKRNEINNSLELAENKVKRKSEFDFVFASNEPSYIHLNCDLVSKKITVRFDYIIFKSLMYQERILEKDLAALPDLITVYCLDKTERSCLLGKIVIPIRELFNLHSLDFTCKWLPDNEQRFENIGFLYYDNDQTISVGHSISSYLPTISKYKPNLLYKQQGNVLYLQSMMQDVNSFRLGKDITFYHFCKNDPSVMLGSVLLNSTKLNNYNYFEVAINTTKEVRLISNYFHLHLEESDAVTDYQF